MRVVALAVIAALVIGSAAHAQDVSKTGVKRPSGASPGGAPPLLTGRTFSSEVYVGDRAPDFALDDGTGKTARLSQHRGHWVVLVFADRVADVKPLRAIDAELLALGARLVAVCHEKSTALRSSILQDSVRFRLMADVTGEIAGRYGLYDTILRRTTPGYYIVDRTGVVRLAILGRGFPAREVAGFARFAITGL